MKILLALVLSLSAVCAFAADLDVKATEKFTSYLPLGYYHGKNDQGEACMVYVAEVNYPKKDLQVRVVTESSDLTKLIEENSLFGYKDYKKEFVQTERSLIGADVYNYVERVVRTTIADTKKLYVVVGYSVVVNRSRDEEVAECIVDL